MSQREFLAIFSCGIFVNICPCVKKTAILWPKTHFVAKNFCKNGHYILRNCVKNIQFGQKPTFFLKLVKKLKILYIVVGNKSGFLATASFLLELAKRATHLHLVKEHQKLYN